MKKIFLLAAAAVTLLASCEKEPNTAIDSNGGKLTIKIAGVASDTRAIEAPGSTAVGTIQLNDGYIFVFAPDGSYVYGESLNVTTAQTTTGQELISQVPSDSRVYVVGNLPGTAASIFGATPNEATVLAATSAITTQAYYTEVALANNNSQPAAILLRTAASGGNPAIYEAAITLSPLISRLELVAIQGGIDSNGGTITGFDVTGVYVDDYHPLFTYKGGYAGTMFEQHQSTTFLGIGNTGTWSATTGSNGAMTATAGSTNVWAYNLASGGLPRLLIELKNIEYTPASGPVQNLPGTFYLTVTGYTGVTTFERGNIYRIGTIGTNDFTFSKDDLGLTPNPVNVKLFVTVEIDEWVLEQPFAEL